jgi:hypothetical protein
MKGFRERRKPTVKEVLRAQVMLEIRIGKLQQQLTMFDDALAYVIASTGVNLKELRQKYMVIKEADGRLILEERNEEPKPEDKKDEASKAKTD